MAMSFESPVSADFSIREFALRGEENADGWGLAWYPDRSLAMVKEPVKWGESRYARFLQTYHEELHSRIHIAHVRHKTVGGVTTHADTHPFAREYGARDYCFAHNGTLEGPLWDLPLSHYRPIGTTDSEYAFCHLLHDIVQRESHLDTEDDWHWLHEKLSWLNGMGKINCLLSDGTRLFCYHDVHAWKGLNFRKIRIKDNHLRHLGDETMQIEVETESINHGFVVATQPLSPHGWHSFRTGELIVLEGGSIRYSSARHHGAPEFSPGRKLSSPPPLSETTEATGEKRAGGS